MEILPYNEIDLYSTALSNNRVPHGPVNSGLMTCFKSSDKSYLFGLS